MSLLRRTALGAVLSCLVLAGMAAPAAAAGQPLGVFAVLGFGSCVSGTGPANAVHRISLLTPSGTLRARFRTTSNAHGEWEGCFPITGGMFGGINGGDQLRLRAAGMERIVPIPNLLPSVDRVANTVRGYLQPGQVVELQVQHAAGFDEPEFTVHSAKAGQNGRYTLDLTGEVDLLGGDIVAAFVNTGPDQFLALAIVPHVQIEHRTNQLVGSAAPDTNLRFVLQSSSGEVKARRGASSFVFGIFVAELFDARGFAAYPEPGDWLTSTLASDAVLQIPGSRLRADASSDTVTGRCMPGSPYQIMTPGRAFKGVTNADGEFSRNLAGKVNIRLRDTVSMLCRYATGDYFFRTVFARR